MKKKLYIKSNGEYEEIDGFLLLNNAKEIKKTSIDDAINKYLSTCTSQKCQKNQKVEAAFFNRFKDYLIKLNIEYISEVKYSQLLEYQNLLLTQMKPSSVNRRLCTLKNFFSMCEKWDLCYNNEAKDIKKKRVQSNPYKNWTDEQFKKFLSLTDGVYKNFFKFLWQTGCRPMELKNLKWTDIDYKNEVIIFNCGKNASINRSFPMTSSLSKILHNTKLDSLYVFSKDKKQINNDALYHYAKKRLKRLGFNDISIYGIRHTFAERLAKANVNPFYIQKLMGHTDLKTTAQYIHDDENKLKLSLNLIKYK